VAKAKTGWSERVRELAKREYVEPARALGTVVKIPFGELKTKLVRIGFPPSHANQVATPLESEKFWGPLGLELVSPKSQPRTVNSVLEFRFSRKGQGPPEQSEADRKRRGMEAFEKLRGLLKDEIAAYGGAEAFIRWVRSDEDEDAA
jgi:hypothetical protein